MVAMVMAAATVAAAMAGQVAMAGCLVEGRRMAVAVQKVERVAVKAAVETVAAASAVVTVVAAHTRNAQ